jgi:hypothetical protein
MMPESAWNLSGGAAIAFEVKLAVVNRTTLNVTAIEVAILRFIFFLLLLKDA